MEILVRTATPDDAEILSVLGKNTFFRKWKNTTSAENMELYLQQNFTPQRMREEIADQSIIYLLATENHKVVAYARLLNTAPDIEVADEDVIFTQNHPLEISRIYVSPELIGKSIGSVLIHKIFELAQKKNCDLIWLGVWENNPAVRFYQRHGFIKAGTHKFIFGNQVDTDWVMVKQLESFH